MLVVKLEIVLNASVGSMLPMPSGLSGSTCCSDTIVKVASHMHDVRDEQRDASTASSPAARADRRRSAAAPGRSIGTSTGSSSVRSPVKTLAMYRPSGRLVAMVNSDRDDNGEVFGAHGEPSELLRPQHRVDEVHRSGNAQDQ